MLSCLRGVRLFVNPWTVTHQAPPSAEFPGKNTGVGGRALLQGIFQTRGGHCNYTDSLVLQNHSYDYMVRYYSDGEYYYSAWSEIIEVETGTYSYPAGTSLKFETSGAKLIYEKSNHTLTINGTITIPGITNFATEYYPMLIIKSETATQTFLISSIADGTDIPLVGMLPQEFLDTDITIQGIVGQKLEFDDISKPVNEWQLKSVSWTEPAPITVIGAGSSKIINIPSQNGSEGFDYSRKAQ